MLVDASGVLMDLGGRKKFSFPVVVGLSSTEPLSTRTASMRIYNELIRELDSGGGHYSQDLSEVDLSDPEDVKVLTNDPEGEVLVHLGSANYLDRFKIYVSHLREWRQQFEKIESVDLRYDQQIIVNPDLQGTAHQPALSAAVARAAISAGVKPSALITREPSHTAPAHIVALKQAPPRSPWKAKAAQKPHTALKTKARQSHWQKHAAPTLRAAKTTPTHTALLKKPQTAPALRKPSPAIPKGEEKQ
jgi:cell division protein FtsQ